MGAIPHLTGTTFRVWAPHAEEVAVIGTFNDWNPKSHSLQPEADGYWATDVPGAKPGDEYQFLLCNNGQELSKNDPYAREVTHSAGNSVVPDPRLRLGRRPLSKCPPGTSS